MSHHITHIPGDWIGPEISAVARRLVEAAGVPVQWEIFDHILDPQTGELDEALLASARRTGVVWMNRVESLRSPGTLPANVLLRKELGCYAQVRHAQTLPGLPARFEGVDIAVIRELGEGIYTGLEPETAPGVYEQIKVTTVAGCERVARFAFEEARRWKRKKVTIVHKSNIMKKSDGLFLRTAQRVGADYPELQVDEVIVDALCMKLVRWPQDFDVLLCDNLFGDIVSDLVAGLAGGPCMGAGTSHGEGVRVFENPHGRCPELVNQDRANPIPTLIPLINLLHQLGEREAAKLLTRSMKTVLQSGFKTPDLGGQSSLSEVEAQLLAAL